MLIFIFGWCFSIMLISCLFIYLISCTNSSESSQSSESSPLPIYGQYSLVDNADGSVDTIQHKIGDFEFLNQDSLTITNEHVKGKIYVADFFFTSCPTICPIMKTQMLWVYDSMKFDPGFLILSHTIDPEYDSVALLRNFAEKLGVESEKWHFLTGEKEDIYKLGQSSYMVTAVEDAKAAGGFVHSGAFILVDGDGHVRGVYDGTDPLEVNDLIRDIKKLKRDEG